MFLLYPLINNSLLFFGLSGISVVFPVIRVFMGKSSYRRETSHWPMGVAQGGDTEMGVKYSNYLFHVLYITDQSGYTGSKNKHKSFGSFIKSAKTYYSYKLP